MMTKMSEKKAPPNYKEKCKKYDNNMNDETVNYCYFGTKVANIYKSSKSEINKINDRWVPSNKLQSGRNAQGLHRLVCLFFY